MNAKIGCVAESAKIYFMRFNFFEPGCRFFVHRLLRRTLVLYE